jgi:hypothetical protein
MKTRLFTHKATLRFRRWCRKGYAAFGSLGRSVTIGCLSVGICDKSLQKQTKTCLPDDVCFLFAEMEEAEQPDLLPDDLLSFFLLTPVVNIPKAVVPFSVKEIGFRVMCYDISGC